MSAYIQVVSGNAVMDVALIDTQKSSIWVRLYSDGTKYEQLSPSDWDIVGLDKALLNVEQDVVVRYTPKEGGAPLYCPLTITLVAAPANPVANPTTFRNDSPIDAYGPTSPDKTVVGVNVIGEAGGIFCTGGSDCLRIGEGVKRSGDWDVYFVEHGKDPVKLEDSQWEVMTAIPSSPCLCGIDILASVNGKAYTCTRACTFANVTPNQHIEIFPATLPDAVLGMEYSVSLDIDASDEYTTSVGGSLPDGLSLSGNRISGVPTELGSFSFSVTAKLASGASDTASFLLAVTPTSHGEAPQIYTTSLPSGVVGAYYEAKIRYSGSEPISWTTFGLPAGLEISETGAIFGYPSASFAGSFSVTAENMAGHADATIRIQIEPASAAPRITTTELPEGARGVSYRAELEVEGAEPIEWSAENLPRTLKIDAVSGTIYGIPSTLGTFNITIRAENVVGASEVQFSLTIRDKVVSAPHIITSALPFATVGTPYSTKLSATGVEPLFWEAADLPGGLVIGRESGIISGTPGMGGDFSVTVTAKNAYGMDTKGFDLTVSGEPEGLVIVPHKTEYAYGERISNGDVEFYYNGEQLHFDNVTLIYDRYRVGSQTVVAGYNSDPYKLEPIVTGTFVVTYASPATTGEKS